MTEEKFEIGKWEIVLFSSDEKNRVAFSGDDEKSFYALLKEDLKDIKVVVEKEE